MDERERLEEYLAWRRAHGKDRRGRIYHRLRLAGAAAALSLLAVTLGVAIGGWPSPARRHVARVPAQPPPDVLADSSPAPAAPALSMRDTTPGMANPPASATAPPRDHQRPSVPSATRRTRAPRAAATAPPSVSDTAPAASPRHDASPAPSGPAPREGSTIVVVEPPATPMPTVIVEPPAVEPPAVPPRAMVTTPGPAPEVVTPAEVPVEGRMQKLKRAAGYIPEVWVARQIARWVQSQPAGEPSSPPSERALPQAR